MLGYVARKLERRRARRTFREYGFEVNHFDLERDGTVAYAQWLHPFEKPKTIVQADVDGYRWFVREGDTVLDIGAHTGDTAVPMAVAAGAAGCVLALEPNPYVFRVLEANAGLNPGRARIIPLNFAATTNDGEFTFHYWDASFGNGGNLSRLRNRRHGHRYPLRVLGRNLERVLRADHAALLPRLSLVKVDAEGSDAEVLESMRGILDQYRPAVVCEVHRKLDAGERDELFAVLERSRYRVHRFLGGAHPIGEPLARAGLDTDRHLDVVGLPA